MALIRLFVAAFALTGCAVTTTAPLPVPSPTSGPPITTPLEKP